MEDGLRWYFRRRLWWGEWEEGFGGSGAGAGAGARGIDWMEVTGMRGGGARSGHWVARAESPRPVPSIAPSLILPS
jgi:hypothetical protein